MLRGIALRPFISWDGNEKIFPFMSKCRQLGGVKTATEVIKPLLPLYLYFMPEILHKIAIHAKKCMWSKMNLVDKLPHPLY